MYDLIKYVHTVLWQKQTAILFEFRNLDANFRAGCWGAGSEARACQWDLVCKAVSCDCPTNANDICEPPLVLPLSSWTITDKALECVSFSITNNIIVSDETCRLFSDQSKGHQFWPWFVVPEGGLWVFAIFWGCKKYIKGKPYLQKMPYITSLLRTHLWFCRNILLRKSASTLSTSGQWTAVICRFLAMCHFEIACSSRDTILNLILYVRKSYPGIFLHKYCVLNFVSKILSYWV